MNSSFSTINTNLQLAWDSTSLGALKECPRKYQLSIIEGWVPRRESVHLTFGLHYHAALERYDHARAEGASHDEATIKALRYALEVTWNRELSRPWLSDDPNKNRWTLVRTIAWYLDQFESDPLKTVVLKNGKPAVELSFRLELDYKSKLTDEKFILCGHLDRVVEFNEQIYVADRKTSKNTIGTDFFDKYSPDNQFSVYTLAMQIIYSLPTAGLIVDAAQVAVTFSRFQRGFVPRHQAQLDEWYRDLGFWLTAAQLHAQAGYWPLNDKSCNNWGGCPYRGICSKAPSVREEWLKADFHKRTWDPLQVRGDI